MRQPKATLLAIVFCLVGCAPSGEHRVPSSEKTEPKQGAATKPSVPSEQPATQPATESLAPLNSMNIRVPAIGAPTTQPSPNKTIPSKPLKPFNGDKDNQQGSPKKPLRVIPGIIIAIPKDNYRTGLLIVKKNKGFTVNIKEYE